MTVVAIVDLDSTLVRGSYLFHFGLSLVRRRILNPRHLLTFVVAEARYVAHGTEPPGIPRRIAECVLDLVRGQDQSVLADLCWRFVGDSLDRFIVPEVLVAIRDLQDLGIPVYIATASPQELADAVADHLRLSGAIGTVAEVRDGRYTGRLASPIAHGVDKLNRVRELFVELNADASRSWAFTDSINDLPLLSAVGWPVVVNGDERLRAVAKSKKWLTIDIGPHRANALPISRWLRRSARWLGDGPTVDVPMH
ncbi:MAG: HAD-IB family hydrolase [Actinobacteria bacterium]|jgi:HAD superfamily hydrolase (TIGR01490 family)|nr:HAD-IB family hydrolase [Actinomycetota bacterium]